MPENWLSNAKSHQTQWVIFALVLRLGGLYVSPLWYDELLSLNRARLPFWEHMAYHVNLWELTLRLFANPILIRIPALACSLLTIWLAWIVIDHDHLNYTDPQRTVTMLLLCILPGLLWMAQDARYYSAVTLIYIASIYFALERRWLGLFAVSGLSTFIHPTAPAYIVPAWVLAMLARPPRRIWLYGLALALIFGLSMSSQINNDFWLDRTDTTYILAQSAVALGASPATIRPAAAFVILACFLALILCRDKTTWIIFLAPLAAMLAANYLIHPVVFYRPLQPLLLGLAMLIGSSAQPRRMLYLVPLAVLLTVLLVKYDPSTHGGHMDHIAQQIRSQWRTGDCIQYADIYSEISFKPLLDDLPTCADGDWILSFAPQAGTLIAVTDGWHFPIIKVYKTGEQHDE